MNIEQCYKQRNTNLENRPLQNHEFLIVLDGHCKPFKYIMLHPKDYLNNLKVVKT